MYLIVKCEELHDQWECDCDRKPYRMVFDAEDFGEGYEVYEIDQHGFLNLVKGSWESAIGQEDDDPWEDDWDWEDDLWGNDEDAEDEGNSKWLEFETKPEPVPEGSIRVIAGTTMRRENYDVSPDTRVSTVMARAGLPFHPGLVTLNGATLRAHSDYDRTFAEYGITSGICSLLEVKVSMNV